MTSSEAVNDDLLRTGILNSDEILGVLDEYSLYCHYLGYEPIPHSGKYRSPIRTDDHDPSFGIFYTDKNPDRTFLFKDAATGVVGDIFRLVQYMYGYPTMRDAEKRVIKDFKLAEVSVEDKAKIIQHVPPPRIDVDIRIASRPFLDNEVSYWSAINIDRQILSIYQTTAVKYYWLATQQVVPYAPINFTFAYRIGTRYQIYQPFASKDIKFRHNFTDKDIPGLLQLKFQSPLLVITKSMKDVMFFYSLGYEAISPRSENTPIQEEYLKKLLGRYPNVVTFFDNDGKNRRDFYPGCYHHEVPIASGEKDPTDYARKYGVLAARSMLDVQLRQYL